MVTRPGQTTYAPFATPSRVIVWPGPILPAIRSFLRGAAAFCTSRLNLPWENGSKGVVVNREWPTMPGIFVTESIRLTYRLPGFRRRASTCFSPIYVLNMVQDDGLAMTEIRRILKPGGLAVVPVPLAADETGMQEVAAHSTVAERSEVFQDAAMFRVYTGEEFKKRLFAAGLALSEFRSFHVPATDAGRWMLLDDCVHTAMAV